MDTQESLMEARAEAAGAKKSRNETFRHIPNNVLEKMRALRAANNRISVMLQFGIGDSTWRKIQAGQPVRKSVADRLIDKIHSIN